MKELLWVLSLMLTIFPWHRGLLSYTSTGNFRLQQQSSDFQSKKIVQTFGLVKSQLIIILTLQSMKNFENLQPYLNQFILLANKVSQQTHYQIAAVVFTVLFAFLLGRQTHEKKLTHLLNMVNDADTTRKQISEKLSKTNESLKSVRQRKKLVWGITILLLLANVVLYYITYKIDLKFIGGSITVLLLVWIIYGTRVRFLSWSKKKFEENLRKTSMNAQSEINQILQLLGAGVTNKMKNIFEKDIDEQWNKESKQPCRLAKCSQQKSAYKELFNLYDKIIDEIKKINLCDICLSQENISVQKLGVAEFENMLKNCKRAVTSTTSLEQKKQIVNRLLRQYQIMYEKLQLVCKKGCCIRQRTLIESSKATHHQDLRRAMNHLHA